MRALSYDKTMKMFLFIVMVGILSLSSRAHASLMDFDFTFGSSSAGVSGSGVFETTSNGDGTYNVINVTGSVLDDSISTVTPEPIIGVSSYYGADNLLTYPGTSYVDFDGISFDTSSVSYDLYAGSGQYYIYDSSPNNFPLDSFTVTPAAVPEPSQYGMGLFLAAAGFIARRRFSARVA